MAFPHAILLGSVLLGASRRVSASPVTRLATHVPYLSCFPELAGPLCDWKSAV